MYKITVLRNPWDFVVSLYWWEARNGINGSSLIPDQRFFYLQQAPFCEIKKDFTKWMSDKIQWPDNWELVTHKNKPIADHILRFEKLSVDMIALQKNLNLPEKQLPLVKTRTRKKGIPYQEYYSKYTKEKVEQLFIKTIHFMGYSFDNII